MASSSLLALIDDIATLLDDMAAMTKTAAHKTAGVLGDDLALNAEQVSGVNAERELPVVWAVAKGSFLNKCILVPLALIISAIAPWAVQPLLMIGGLYLCYEGVEKIAHKYLHAEEHEAHHDELVEAVVNPEVDMVEFEQNKIKGAIRTDFILSAEIIVISLGTLTEATLLMRCLVLSTIAIVMTVGVYGLVGGIVKLDDGGLYLSKQKDSFRKAMGAFLLKSAPYLMKGLSIAGTAAMFLVGGGILVHGIPHSHEWVHHQAHGVSEYPVVGHFLEAITPTFINGVAGIIAGAIALLMMSFAAKIIKPKAASSH